MSVLVEAGPLGDAPAQACPIPCAAMPCSQASRERCEPLPMQAPAISGYLLVEHLGPWGPHPADESRLIPAALRHAARERGIRLHFIRRNGRKPFGNNVFLVSPGMIERLRVDHLSDLPPHTIDALAAGVPTGAGSIVDGPLYLACTHGKVDACCARLGRPVAQALTAFAGDRAWETSHIGGCRFAANMIALPYGVYYGRLSDRDIPIVVTSTDRGDIALPWYRGRAGLPQSAQFAEAFLRRLTQIRGVDDIQLVRIGRCADGHGHDLHQVELASPVGRHHLLLRQQVSKPGRIVCADISDRTTVTYQVISMVDEPGR